MSTLLKMSPLVKNVLILSFWKVVPNVQNTAIVTKNDLMFQKSSLSKNMSTIKIVLKRLLSLKMSSLRKKCPHRPT